MGEWEPISKIMEKIREISNNSFEADSLIYFENLLRNLPTTAISRQGDVVVNIGYLEELLTEIHKFMGLFLGVPALENKTGSSKKKKKKAKRPPDKQEGGGSENIPTGTPISGDSSTDSEEGTGQPDKKEDKTDGTEIPKKIPSGGTGVLEIQKDGNSKKATIKVRSGYCSVDDILVALRSIGVEISPHTVRKVWPLGEKKEVEDKEYVLREPLEVFLKTQGFTVNFSGTFGTPVFKKK